MRRNDHHLAVIISTVMNRSAVSINGSSISDVPANPCPLITAPLVPSLSYIYHLKKLKVSEHSDNPSHSMLLT